MVENDPKSRRRAIYLLPNLFTTAALFAGFYAVVSAMHDFFAQAAVAIIVAQILDGFDGRIARSIQAESDFGAQYDSMSDLVAFGVAPALVALSWSLSSLGKLGWMAAFVYLACAALRLARFNTQIGVVDRKYFLGLASPPAAALIASLVWVCTEAGIDSSSIAVIGAIIVVSTGLLMVSNIPYHSFKSIDVKERIPFIVLLAIIFAFAVIFIDPARTIFTMAVVYVFSGPALYLFRRYKKKRLITSETDSD